MPDEFARRYPNMTTALWCAATQPEEDTPMESDRNNQTATATATKCNPMGDPGHSCLECQPGPVYWSGRAAREAAQDPWQHRAVSLQCTTCMWFVAKGDGPSQADPTKRQLGRCRRHAPTMNGYPVVYTTDWCGDHKLDETRL